MRHLNHIVIAASMAFLLPTMLFAQTEPVVVEAESGVLGSAFSSLTVADRLGRCSPP